jgi:uncharacterized protein (TIGR02118 family)
MIHQLIFAAPKPGMTDEEFCSYWLDVHAVKFASKIPQVRKYKIDTRVPFGDGDGPPWQGVGEIWLANEEEQLASLQTPEFLDGARADEPNWAAFWLAVVLDTDAHVLLEPPAQPPSDAAVKMIRLVKRAEGVGREEFTQRSLGLYADLVGKVPGLRGHLQNHTKNALYTFGEAVLDCAHQLWFDDVESLTAALGSAQFQAAERELSSFTEKRYLHEMVVKEHWVIGPDSR